MSLTNVPCWTMKLRILWEYWIIWKVTQRWIGTSLALMLHSQWIEGFGFHKIIRSKKQYTWFPLKFQVWKKKKKWQLITVIYQSVWNYYTEFYFLLYFFGTRFSFDRCATDEREMCVTETDNYHLEVIMYMYMKSPFHKFVFTKHIPKACSHPIKSTIKHWKWSTKHPPPLLTVPGWRHSDLWHRKWPFSSCLNCS